jgi:SRSO17 transposase
MAPFFPLVEQLQNAQGLHHFLTQSPWEAPALRRQRLELILKLVKERWEGDKES